jgi:hypothetical protein
MQFYTGQHEHYIGIDLHASSMYVASLTPGGRRSCTAGVPECLFRPAQVVSGGVLAPTLILNDAAELPPVKVGTTVSVISPSAPARPTCSGGRRGRSPWGPMALTDFAQPANWPPS